MKTEILFVMTLVTSLALFNDTSGFAQATKPAKLPAPAPGGLPGVPPPPSPNESVIDEPLPQNQFQRSLLTIPAPRMLAQAGAADNFSYRVGKARDSVPSLILHFTASPDGKTSELEEDLLVMARLLQKSLETGLEDNPTAFKAGIPLLVNSSRQSVRAMYLEGFGALFMVKVGFPVTPPAAVAHKKPAAATATEWEKAKDEVLNEEAVPAGFDAEVTTDVDYDAAQVENLKKGLLHSLKNAANIRQLKPEEFVSVTVFGAPNTAVARVVTRVRNAKTPTAPKPGSGQDAGRVPQDVVREVEAVVELARAQALESSARAVEFSAGRGAAKAAGAQGTILALRVKRADVDAFARGKLDYAAFEKAVTAHAYAGSGYNATSLNSWAQPAGRSAK